MHGKRDIHDYVRRLLLSVLFCPVAIGAWFVFFQAGFSFDGVLAYLGDLSRQYAGMSLEEQSTFRFQVFAVWGVLAFGFLFLSFAMNPPHFHYQLKKVEQHWTTDVVED